jgi:hypothetical protein
MLSVLFKMGLLGISIYFLLTFIFTSIEYGISLSKHYKTDDLRIIMITIINSILWSIWFNI